MIKRFINKLLSKKTVQIDLMKEGTVKFFNKTKGFGFIKLNDSEDEIFVHTTNLIDKIRDNDRVKFDVEQGEKGLVAMRVQRI